MPHITFQMLSFSFFKYKIKLTICTERKISQYFCFQDS